MDEAQRRRHEVFRLAAFTHADIRAHLAAAGIRSEAEKKRALLPIMLGGVTKVFVGELVELGARRAPVPSLPPWLTSWSWQRST
jgi:hypothetical protein